MWRQDWAGSKWKRNKAKRRVLCSKSIQQKVQSKWIEIKTKLCFLHPFCCEYHLFLVLLSVSLSLSSISILRCLWFCCVVGSACQQGRTPARWLRTEPSWESWLRSPRRRNSAVLRSPHKPGSAPGNGRSQSRSTTHHRPWTESEQMR